MLSTSQVSSLLLKNKALIEIFKFLNSLYIADKITNFENLFEEVISIFNTAKYIKENADFYRKEHKHTAILPHIVINNSPDPYGIFSIIMAMVDEDAVILTEIPYIDDVVDSKHGEFIFSYGLTQRIKEYKKPVREAYLTKDLNHMSFNISRSSRVPLISYPSKPKIINQVSFRQEDKFIEDVLYCRSCYGLNFKPIINDAYSQVTPVEKTLMGNTIVRIDNPDYLPF